MDELVIRIICITIYLNVISVSFLALIKDIPWQKCMWIFVLLEYVGMNVYLYNIVGFQCIASCSTEYV